MRPIRTTFRLDDGPRVILRVWADYVPAEPDVGIFSGYYEVTRFERVDGPEVPLSEEEYERLCEQVNKEIGE